MTRPRLRVALVLAASAAALGAGAAAAGAAPASPARADHALDRALQGLVTMRDGPPGVIAIVQRGARPVTHAAGVASLRSNRHPRAADAMRIASASKAFSGATALSLVSRGVLGLDDTIAQRLPGLPPAWGAVTLREALQHTSGLPDFTESPAFGRALMASPKHAPPPATLLSFVKDDPLRFPPGSEYRYSNTDNIVVALMVQAVTGQSYERQLQQQVLARLGLRGTSLPRGVAMGRPFIHGYEPGPPPRPPEDQTQLVAAGWSWASGGIVSTPADVNRFARAYASGRLVSAQVRGQQLRFVPGSSGPPGPGVNSAGLGIFRYRTGCGTVYGHTGNIFGYTQFFAATLDGRRSATVSINEQVNEHTLSHVYAVLRAAEGRAVCAALASR